MAQIDLNLGTSANSNDGDTLRGAMQAIQTNTTEFYIRMFIPLKAIFHQQAHIMECLHMFTVLVKAILHMQEVGFNYKLKSLRQLS